MLTASKSLEPTRDYAETHKSASLVSCPTLFPGQHHCARADVLLDSAFSRSALYASSNSDRQCIARSCACPGQPSGRPSAGL
jgi:hypothetical protein